MLNLHSNFINTIKYNDKSAISNYLQEVNKINIESTKSVENNFKKEIVK